MASSSRIQAITTTTTTTTARTTTSTARRTTTTITSFSPVMVPRTYAHSVMPPHPLGQALRSVGSPATALAGGVGETVQPRALKSDPTEILPLIHGNILSQYPVWRVTPGRFVDPSAWTRKTQIGGDSVKKSVVNESRSSGLSPLDPMGQSFWSTSGH